MTSDKIEKDKMVFGHLSDLEVAGKVRMLMRNDLDHEAVCVGARDRIIYLSQEVERFKDALFRARKLLMESETPFYEGMKILNLHSED